MASALEKSLIVPDELNPSRELIPKQKTWSNTGCTTEAWKLIDDQAVPSADDRRESDLAFWWQRTGVTLAVLLQNAHYSFEDQCRNLHLYRHAVVPELGAGSDANGLTQYWKSFMTDHHCPLEFSWEWNLNSEAPTVRYSFEPIGELAGTSSDPTNQYAALRFVNANSANIEGCDLNWFWHLWNSLMSFEEPANGNVSGKWNFYRILSLLGIAGTRSRDQGKESRPNSVGHKSRCFLALDLGISSLSLKAYFMPGFKAEEAGRTTMSVICDAIESLPSLWEDIRPSYTMMMSFLNDHAVGKTLKPEIVATDCVAPADSRIKIYLRTSLTSLQSALTVFTLGGAVEDSISKAGLEKFRQLWNLIWNEGKDWQPEDELDLASHRTGGLLYYFELRPGKKVPAVKIYLPLRHHNRPDMESALALQEFLRSTSRNHFTDDYLRALEQIISLSSGRSRNRVQTYLTCMVVGDKLRLTSYLAPVVYRFMGTRS